MTLREYLNRNDESMIDIRFMDEDESWLASEVSFNDETLDNSEIVSVSFSNDMHYVLVAIN